MSETMTLVRPVLAAVENVAELAEAAKLRGATPPSWEIDDPAEACAVLALSAAGVLAEYAKAVGDIGEDVKVALYDLLADLRHLADATGIDWDEVNETACNRYREEVNGEL